MLVKLRSAQECARLRKVVPPDLYVCSMSHAAQSARKLRVAPAALPESATRNMWNSVERQGHCATAGSSATWYLWPLVAGNTCRSCNSECVKSRTRPRRDAFAPHEYSDSIATFIEGESLGQFADDMASGPKLS